MQSIQIRTATSDDVSLILAFIRELAEYERLSHEVVATETSLEDSLFGEHANSEVLIAELEKKPVGFALFFSTYSTFLSRQGIYLEDVYVRESVRGRGVGQRLLAEVARLAVERNCGRLEWSVLDWNEPAIEFYNRLGAVPQQEWIRYRITDESLEKLAAGANA